jgi:uncharacterized protein with ParB-like and HNH nuclease domain
MGNPHKTKKSLPSVPNLEELLIIEQEVERNRTRVKYWITDSTVELHAQNFKTGEYFIPAYQRELTWEIAKKSKFVESILMNLPIPFLTGV